MMGPIRSSYICLEGGYTFHDYDGTMQKGIVCHIYTYICWGEWHVVAWQVSEIVMWSDIMFVGGGHGNGEGEMAIGQTGEVAHSLHECVICFV